MDTYVDDCKTCTIETDLINGQCEECACDRETPEQIQERIKRDKMVRITKWCWSRNAVQFATILLDKYGTYSEIISKTVNGVETFAVYRK